MSRLHVTLNAGTDQEVTLSFVQARILRRLQDGLDGGDAR